MKGKRINIFPPTQQPVWILGQSIKWYQWPIVGLSKAHMLQINCRCKRVLLLHQMLTKHCQWSFVPLRHIEFKRQLSHNDGAKSTFKGDAMKLSVFFGLKGTEAVAVWSSLTMRARGLDCSWIGQAALWVCVCVLLWVFFFWCTLHLRQQLLECTGSGSAVFATCSLANSQHTVRLIVYRSFHSPVNKQPFSSHLLALLGLVEHNKVVLGSHNYSWQSAYVNKLYS